MKITRSLLLAAALASPGAAHADQFDPANMSDAERKAFGEAVRAYLLDNPQVIMEAVEVLEQRQQQASADRDKDLVADNAKEIFDDGFSFVDGNLNGDVTIVEFLDYRCGYCKRAHPVVQELMESDPNLKLVVKEFPILGPNSVAAGRMALAAVELDPSLYKDLNDELMSYQGDLTEAMAYRIAGQAGYDIAKLKDLAADDKISDRLNRNYQLAQKLGVQGTPAFVIGDRVIRGFLPIEDMQASAARSANRARSKVWGTSSLLSTRCRWLRAAPDKNATSSGVSARPEVTQDGIRGRVPALSTKGWRTQVMPQHYRTAALLSTK